jgi:hypothetical protein
LRAFWHWVVGLGGGDMEFSALSLARVSDGP